jgi:HK97 family phage portal protein
MITQSRILWLPNGAEDRHVSWDDVSPSSTRNPSGVRIDSDTALQSTVVLACARVLAESLAALPLHLYEYLPGGGKAPAKEHPLYRRLHVSPNSWQTAFEWREQQVLWLALWGNAYNLLVPGAAGFATELWPLHPSRMKPERIENGRIRYKYRDENGREETYTQDQIMHIRWLSDDGLEGMVPVELARDAIGLARACEIHGARFFGNGARPGFVLTTDNDMKPEAASMLRDNWERMHRGPDRSNRTAVLFGGLKPHELGSASNQESQFLETRRFQIEEVCRLYRVPPHLVGDLTRSSFSNIEQQSIDFVQHTLLPWCRRFENAFARDLIVEDDKYFAEFDTRGLLRGDAAARASYYSSMYNLGVASINEIRSWENLNPIEGGDLRFVQLNMQTLDQANVTATATKEPEAEPQVEEQPTAAVGDLVALVEQIGSGAITPDAAKAAFASVFPQMPESVAAAIIEGAIKKPEPEPTVTEPMPEKNPAEVAEQPAPAPAGRSLWQGSLRDSEGRSLTISIDFDRTFAADPELMGDFAAKAKADGNTVVMITRRADTPEDRDFIEQTLGSYADAFDSVILAGPDTQKESAAKQAGISVDIWIDDSPQTIKEIRGFCPTGPGGGIDNSCGKEGGGGSVAAVGDTLKRKDVQVGQTISVQKHGQQKVHNGVVTGVKHEAAVSEITLKDADGNETTIRIRNLAQIREANLGDSGKIREPSEKKGPNPGKTKTIQEVPEKPTGGSKKERERFRQEVKDFCASHGVSVEDSFSVGRQGSTIDSLHEVAVGVNRLVKSGQEPPPVIVMTRPQKGHMGYFSPHRPDAIFVNARLPAGEPQGSINNGFLAGTGSSGRGTIIVHENAHRLHQAAVGEQEFRRFPRIQPRGGTTLSFRDHQVAGQVSRYAQTCEVEFVAETYSGHVAGRRYSDDVYTLYNRLGGPRLREVKFTKSGKVKVKN